MILVLGFIILVSFDGQSLLKSNQIIAKIELRELFTNNSTLEYPVEDILS